MRTTLCLTSTVDTRIWVEAGQVSSSLGIAPLADAGLCRIHINHSGPFLDLVQLELLPPRGFLHVTID